MPSLPPEQHARAQIDAQLAACGWIVQDYRAVDFSAGRGIALREAPLQTGPCDYLLLVDRQAVGVLEAKKEGTTLSAVATGGEAAGSPTRKRGSAASGAATGNRAAARNEVVRRRRMEHAAGNRDDFWATTSNKQLNFLQHIFTILKQHGRAALVLPDNVLFEGGAGETIRRALLKAADVHTLLRLPTGIFYAQGVKANVLFFDRKPAQEKPWTKKLWIYDLRTNMHFTLKEKTLQFSDLQDFIAACNRPNRHERKERERFKAFTYDELAKRDKVNLDIFWLKDEALEESANLPAPEFIAQEITDDLEAALEEFAAIAEDLK